MFDVFTKSQAEPARDVQLSKLARTPGQEDAWRILRAIDGALENAATETSMLSERIESATAAAAVSLGNGNDEYLVREAIDTHHLNLFDAQIRDGAKDLGRHNQNILCYKMLKAALLKAFPEISQTFEA